MHSTENSTNEMAGHSIIFYSLLLMNQWKYKSTFPVTRRLLNVGEDKRKNCNSKSVSWIIVFKNWTSTPT